MTFNPERIKQQTLLTELSSWFLVRLAQVEPKATGKMLSEQYLHHWFVVEANIQSCTKTDVNKSVETTWHLSEEETKA